MTIRRLADEIEAATRAADAYLTFAADHPALYDAMFVLPTGLRFGKDDTIAPLRETFAALAAIVAPFIPRSRLRPNSSGAPCTVSPNSTAQAA